MEAAKTAASAAQSTANSAQTTANTARTEAGAAQTTADSVASAASAAQTAADNAQTTASSKAPTSHASTATTYGIGTSANYGHVKLSDSISTTSGASAGIAATPTAVKAAYDKAMAAGCVVGTYTGDGTAAKTVSLGFTPSFVIVGCRNIVSVLTSRGLFGSNAYYNSSSNGATSLAHQITINISASLSYGADSCCISGGFSVRGAVSSIQGINYVNQVYEYIAFR